MTNDPLVTVEGLIGQGAPFEEIERYIETLPLPSEQLGALWLLAWAEATDPATRRRVVAELLAAPMDHPAGARAPTAPGASVPSRLEQRRVAFPKQRRG
jgi:hypothetical protein